MTAKNKHHGVRKVEGEPSASLHGVVGSKAAATSDSKAEPPAAGNAQPSRKRGASGAAKKSAPSDKAAEAFAKTEAAAVAKFRKRFPRHWPQGADALYALPPWLLDEFERHAPGLFSPEDLAFERELAEFSGGAIFQGRRISIQLCSGFSTPNRDMELLTRTAKTDREIESMLREEMASAGVDRAKADRYVAAQEHFKRMILDRQRPYAGWLVTNPTFRRELEEFKAWWLATTDESARLPHLPLSAFGEQGVISGPSSMQMAMASTFLKRWCLAEFMTWDVPMPIAPGSAQGSIYEPTADWGAGLTIFVPWYLMRDKELTLHELANAHRTASDVRNLAGWLDGKPKNLGYVPHARMLDLYVYIELALKRRYRDRLRRRTGQLDVTFGNYFAKVEGSKPKDAEESMRKLRQLFDKRMAEFDAPNTAPAPESAAETGAAKRNRRYTH